MQNPLHILIVEDNAITAADIRETLEKAGHRVTGMARDSHEAIASLRRPPLPDLALLDIRLEGSSLDGISTAKELLRLHPMPILYLTANSEYKTFQRAKETLPAAYLLKPFRRAELAMQVELAYQHHRVNQKDNGPATADLYLPINNGYERVAKSNVVLVEAKGAFVNVFLADEPMPYRLSMNLGYLEQFFTTPNFHRLSRSVLINIDYLARVERDQVVMKYHTKPLPVPENNRPLLMKKLTVVKTR